MKRVSPTGGRGCEAADGRSDRRNGAFRAPAGAANPHAAAAGRDISALRVAVGRGALRDSADGRDLERHQRPVPSLAGLRRPPATAPRPTRSHRRRRLDPGAAPPAAPAGASLRDRPRPRRPLREDPLRPLRPQRLLDSPHPRPEAAHARGRRHLRPHLRTGRPSSPAIGAATTPGRSSRPPSTSKGSSPPPPRPTHTPPATAFASPSPPPPRSSIASPNVASRYARTPPGSSPSSTTTGRRNSPPPSPSPSNATPSAPASSPTSSRPDVGSADSAAPPAHPAGPARTA